MGGVMTPSQNKGEKWAGKGGGRLQEVIVTNFQ